MMTNTDFPYTRSVQRDTADTPAARGIRRAMIRNAQIGELGLSDLLSVLSDKQKAGLRHCLTPANATAKPKPKGPSDVSRGFAAGRSLERDRLAEVAAFAKARGQEGKALDLLANTDLDASAIKAKLGSGAAVWDKAIAALGGEKAQ